MATRIPIEVHFPEGGSQTFPSIRTACVECRVPPTTITRKLKEVYPKPWVTQDGFVFKYAVPITSQTSRRRWKIMVTTTSTRRPELNNQTHVFRELLCRLNLTKYNKTKIVNGIYRSPYGYYHESTGITFTRIN